MGSVVVAMPKVEDANRIADIIKRSSIWEDPIVCSLGSETLNLSKERDVSIVVCTKKLKDMGYEELSDYLPSFVNMVLLTQDAELVPFSSNIIKLLMPFRSGDLINTINMLTPVREVKSKPKPKRSLEEQKLIEKAKEILMVRNEMSEEEAFRYVQKTSMDSGRTMVETAQMIIMMNAE